MKDIGLVERVRTRMQNRHPFDPGTPEERAAHRAQEETRYLAMLAARKGIHW